VGSALIHVKKAFRFAPIAIDHSRRLRPCTVAGHAHGENPDMLMERMNKEGGSARCQMQKFAVKFHSVSRSGMPPS
jgi:hypothetical protein